jgi:hypothetical protein
MMESVNLDPYVQTGSIQIGLRYPLALGRKLLPHWELRVGREGEGYMLEASTGPLT